MSAKTGTFTAKQLERLPEPGYVVQFNKDDPPNDVIIVCIMNGQVKYARAMNAGGTWYTLLWSCAPTRRQVAAGGDQYSSYVWYPDFASAFAAHPYLPVKTKAPNDF